MWRSTGARLAVVGRDGVLMLYCRTIQPDRRAASTTDQSVSFTTTYNSGWTPYDRNFDQLLIVLRCTVRRSGESRNVVNRVSSRLPSCCCSRWHWLSVEPAAVLTNYTTYRPTFATGDPMPLRGHPPRHLRVGQTPSVLPDNSPRVTSSHSVLSCILLLHFEVCLLSRRPKQREDCKFSYLIGLHSRYMKHNVNGAHALLTRRIFRHSFAVVIAAMTWFTHVQTFQNCNYHYVW